MRDGSTIAFIEVRLRNRTDFGSGAESVDARKQTRVSSSAEHYLQRHATLLADCRFDVVSILQRLHGNLGLPIPANRYAGSAGQETSVEKATETTSGS